MSAETETRPWQDAATLHHLYIEADLPMGAVAERLGCSKATVSRWLRRHDIETAGSARSNEYSDADLVGHLRAVNQDCEYRVTETDLREADGPSAKTYVKRFGSWTAALDTAGIDPDAPTRPVSYRETLDGDQGSILLSNQEAARELLRVPVPFRFRESELTQSTLQQFRKAGILEHHSDTPTNDDAVEGTCRTWEWQPAPDVRGWIREHVDPAGTCPAADCEATGVRNPRGVEGYRCTSETCDYELNRREAREVLGG